jgi:hypothetical protein
MFLLLLSMPMAAAQPRIPANELPGRERERFIDSPILQLDRRPAPVIVVPNRPKPVVRQKCRSGKARHRRGC